LHFAPAMSTLTIDRSELAGVVGGEEPAECGRLQAFYIAAGSVPGMGRIRVTAEDPKDTARRLGCAWTKDRS